MKTIEIAGETFTLYRTHHDQPYAEVYVQRGERREGRPDISINTQYAIVEPVHADDCGRKMTLGGTTIADTCTCGKLAALAPIKEELIQVARAFRSNPTPAAKPAVLVDIETPETPIPAAAATTYMGQASLDHEDSIF